MYQCVISVVSLNKKLKPENFSAHKQLLKGVFYLNNFKNSRYFLLELTLRPDYRQKCLTLYVYVEVMTIYFVNYTKPVTSYGYEE
jgi:hypothetical protein